MDTTTQLNTFRYDKILKIVEHDAAKIQHIKLININIKTQILN